MIDAHMPAPSPKRALLGKSVRELMDYKQGIGSELRAHVYVLTGEKFIVAPLDGMRGLFVEQREVSVLPFDIEDETLGRCVCDNLLWNISSTPDDLQNRKGSDWPAFKSSGLTAMKHFQQTGVRISISTVNMTFRMEARPMETLDRIYVGVGLPLAALHMEIAAEIRNTLKAVKVLQDANLM